MNILSEIDEIVRNYDCEKEYSAFNLAKVNLFHSKTDLDFCKKSNRDIEEYSEKYEKALKIFIERKETLEKCKKLNSS